MATEEGPNAGQPDAAVDEVTNMFADLKKKKKKKKVTIEDPTTATADIANDAANDDDDDAVADPETNGTSTAHQQANGDTVENDEDDDLDFTAGLKKKKKKKDKTTSEDAARAFEQELEEAGVVTNDTGDVDIDEEDEGGEDLFDREGEPLEPGLEPWHGSDRDYSYSELLNRVFSIIRAANPDSDVKGALKRIPPPQVFREGNKKTVFANLSEICKRMKRSPEHVVQFMFAELGTSGSVDGSARLVIKGRFQGKQLENVIRRYIIEYVSCKTCRSSDTVLSKENRIYFMDCEKCGSRRSVGGIKTGYRANLQKRRLRVAA